MIGLASLRSLLAGEVRAVDVAINDAAGNQLSGFDPSRPDTATLTQPAVSTTSAVIVAANAARRKFIIVNTSGKTLFVAFAATATATAYTVNIGNGGIYESDLNGYTGDVSAILASGSGAVKVTELTKA